MTFPAFKAGDSVLSGSNGGFDFHTPPPFLFNINEVLEQFTIWSAVHVPKKDAAASFPRLSDGLVYSGLPLRNPLGIVLFRDFDLRVAEQGSHAADGNPSHQEPLCKDVSELVRMTV